MGLDVYFDIQIHEFGFRKVSETRLRGFNFPRFGWAEETLYTSDEQGKAWVTTLTSMHLLSLGKAHGIFDFLHETLGQKDDGRSHYQIPKDKVLYTLAQLYTDCLNKRKRTENYPWLDCFGHLEDTKEWLENFIICPKEAFSVSPTGTYRLNFEGPCRDLDYRVRFRDECWEEALQSDKIRFEWVISV